MPKHQLKKYCEAEFENIDTVVFELFSIVKTAKSEYSNAELAAIATFIHNCYSSTLRWDELKPLVQDLEKTLKTFRSAIYNFIDKQD